VLTEGNPSRSKRKRPNEPPNNSDGAMILEYGIHPFLKTNAPNAKKAVLELSSPNSMRRRCTATPSNLVR
ncbi:hypothetical protein A2U01_0082820, partial [Trifolium medium]|nr:hypothetical protein [Trifolium medium]